MQFNFNNEFATQVLNDLALKLAILLFAPLIILIPLGILIGKYCNNYFIKQIFSLFTTGLYVYWMWIFFKIAF